MSLARFTIGLARLLEGRTEGRGLKSGGTVWLTILACLLILATGVILLFAPQTKWAIPIGGSAVFILLMSLMIVRHEWLFILAVIWGHTIFYGRLDERQFGFRIANAIGPAEALFFMAFVAAIAYWASEKERPPIYFSLVWPPLIAFLFAAGYMAYAYFFMGRTEYMMNQSDGWLLFPLALVAYLCLASGKVWKPFFVILLVTLLISGFMSTLIELGIGKDAIRRIGYGTMSTRSYGDSAVKTQFLAMCIIASCYALVVIAFAKKTKYRLLGIAGLLCGLWILFLDRGRIHWVGMALALIIVLFCLPIRPRLNAIYGTAVAGLVCLLLVLMSGPAAVKKVGETVEKAQQRIQVSSSRAVLFDEGLVTREREINAGKPFFYDNPLFGGGPGTLYGSIPIPGTDRSLPKTWMDTTWWYVLSHSGLVGLFTLLLGYGFLLGTTIVMYIKLRNPFHKALAIAPLGIVAFTLVGSTVTGWFAERTYMAAFSLAVGVSCALLFHERTRGSEVPVVDV
ncbi:MAG: O-antigen ligase family protein [Fimbriimonadales bacterium]